MKRSNLAAALRTEIRRLSRQQVGGALRPLLRVQRQVSALRREAHLQRLTLSRLERRVSRLRSARRLGVSLVPGRRGRPLSGQSIRRLRDKLRLTREQFARALQVSAGSIFGWESGRTVPRSGSLKRFEELRKMSVKDARAQFQAGRAARRAAGGRPRRARRRSASRKTA